MTRLEVETRPTTDACVVVVRGDIDSSVAAELSGRIQSVQRRRNAGMVVDLWDVHFMESAGLQVLLRARDRAEYLRRGFAVVADPAGHVARVIELVGLSKRLRMSPSVDAALTVISSSVR